MKVSTFRGFVRTEETDALPTAMSMVLDIMEAGFGNGYLWARITDEQADKDLYYLMVVGDKMKILNQQTGDVSETLLFT